MRRIKTEDGKKYYFHKWVSQNGGMMGIVEDSEGNMHEKPMKDLVFIDPVTDVPNEQPEFSKELQGSKDR